MICPNCGASLKDGLNFCTSCGMSLRNGLNDVQRPNGNVTTFATERGYSNASTLVNQANPLTGNGQVQKDTKGFAIASMACGIVGLVLSLIIPYVGGLIGFILGIIAIVLYSNGTKRGQHGGIATAGLVCGILSICFGMGSVLCTLCVSGIIGTGVALNETAASLV